MLNIRKNSKYAPTLVYGEFKSYLDDDKNVFVYTRSDENNSLMVATNMTNQEIEVSLPFDVKEIVLSNYQNNHKDNKVKLKPFESFLSRI